MSSQDGGPDGGDVLILHDDESDGEWPPPPKARVCHGCGQHREPENFNEGVDHVSIRHHSSSASIVVGL